METTLAAPTTLVPRGPDRAMVWLRLALLSLCAALVAGMLMFGVRESSMAQLRADLASDRVSDLRVSGGLAEGAFGRTTQQVRWRAGWTQHQASVQHVRRMGEAPDARPDVGARLQAEYPDLAISRGPISLPGVTIVGWGMPGQWGLMALLIWLVAVVGLMVGTEPWRATRWAWFWLLSTPIGWVAFLAMSGPLSPFGAPANPSRRLTGGWAFLLSLLLGSFFNTR